MLTKTTHSVTEAQITTALNNLPDIDFRMTINKPTGNFFYDGWVIKDEYKNTIWEELLNQLPGPIGEARIISLPYAKCYQVHADIDDRYHLNLSGTHSYLIDLNNDQMYKLLADTYWYNLNAGNLHSAVNFGRTDRVQLVVRHLLKNNKLTDSVPVTMLQSSMDPDDARFLFDNTLSSWFNLANKQGIINNFEHVSGAVKFNIERSQLENLKNILPTEFRIEL